MVHLFADVTSAEGTHVVTLNKYNYGTFAAGPNINTYTAAATAAAIPVSAGNYPLQYTAGWEGIFSVTRTGVGLWTIKLQDNYNRLLVPYAYPSTAGGTPTFASMSENTTITNMASAGGSLIGLAFWDFAGVAVDPIGHVRLSLILCDATEP